MSIEVPVPLIVPTVHQTEGVASTVKTSADYGERTRPQHKDGPGKQGFSGAATLQPQSFFFPNSLLTDQTHNAVAVAAFAEINNGIQAQSSLDTLVVRIFFSHPMDFALTDLSAIINVAGVSFTESRPTLAKGECWSITKTFRRQDYESYVRSLHGKLMVAAGVKAKEFIRSWSYSFVDLEAKK